MLLVTALLGIAEGRRGKGPRALVQLKDTRGLRSPGSGQSFTKDEGGASSN